jgi:hypothetical protein
LGGLIGPVKIALLGCNQMGECRASLSPRFQLAVMVGCGSRKLAVTSFYDVVGI